MFFTRAWSSCRTSPTCASYFSRSVHSVAALFSASDSACLRVATSVVAPTIATLILSLFCNCTFLYLNKVFLTFLVLELLLGKPELPLRLIEVLCQCVHLRSQCGGC